MRNFKILGINSDSDTCSICGKTGLKRVVCIESESGEVIYLGCECASKLLVKAKIMSVFIIDSIRGKKRNSQR